jgi:hypothetical protein
MDITKGDIGPEAKYTVVFTNAKLKADLNYAGKMGGAGLFIEIGAEQVIDALKEAIPGSIDDAIFDVIKMALKAQG